MSLKVSQMLQNRYRIVSLLGQGGMGAVYRAWDTRLNAPVALKEMIPQPGTDTHTLAQLRQQFQQEAIVLGRLNHPHLVGVTDFFEERGNDYLVMKFIEGESLADRIKREGALPEGEVLAWAKQLLDALAYCHSQGVIHRDVKPQNVILRSNGQAVLVDFGLVKLWDPHDPRTKTAMRGMGTPEYAPPEQYDTQMGHTDARSDVYSVGATLHHALTGQVPPTATARIVNPTALVPVQVLRPGMSPHIEAAVTRALELQPADRFESARKMKTALKKSSVAPPPRRTASAQVVPRTSPTPGRGAIPWAWVGLAGAVIVAIMLVGGMVLGMALLFGERKNFPPVIGSASATPTSGTVSASEDVSAATSTSIPISPSPTPVSTPFPTPTPQPTATPQPTSTPLPTETPAPACPVVTGPFASIWQEMQEQLGCMVNQSHTTWMAEEHFERGQMFWREDTDMMSVLYNTGKWASYQNIWREGDPGYSCPESAPTENPPTPIRGFGRIWCTYADVRDGLGWATTQERGYYATVQDFEHGSAIRTDGGTTYVLYDGGWWERR